MVLVDQLDLVLFDALREHVTSEELERRPAELLCEVKLNWCLLERLPLCFDRFFEYLSHIDTI